MDAVRLIHDPPSRGSWNMAVDEVLLNSVASAAVSCLRFYAWDTPTLSLGYFQTYAARREHTASRDLPVVRRSTGGGAIVHDRDLTYSLVVPSRSRFAASSDRLVTRVHEALARALSSWGLWLELQPAASRRPGRAEPFLCFLRRSVDDGLLNGSKIIGSAQRRHRGATLVQGTVLLHSSRYAPELTGIDDLAAKPHLPPAAELAGAWTDELAAAMKREFRSDVLTELERASARQVEGRRYLSGSWTRKR